MALKKWRHVPLCCPGYERTHHLETYECKPVCDSCQFGMCVSPNRCRCDDGEYMLPDPVLQAGV